MQPTYTRKEIINILESNPTLDQIKAVGWMVREEHHLYSDADYCELCYLTEKKIFAYLEKMANEIFKIYSDLSND